MNEKQVDKAHSMSGIQRFIKRGADITISLLALIILSPVYLLIALLVGRPCIYGQERIGKGGKPFRILKFRTMHPNAEADKPQLAQDDDPRVTAVGRCLRKYRLDELPQFWNVLKGDMSLVGPRPERAYFIKQIIQKAPYYDRLYAIRPGLTSWGPIKVGYTDTLEKMIERLDYDIDYLEHMSLTEDMKILWHTVGVLFDGKGK